MRQKEKSFETLPLDYHLTIKLEILLQKNKNVSKQFDIGKGVLPCIEPYSTLLLNTILNI